MLYVQIKGGKAVLATTEFPQSWNGWENRNDWKSFEAAERIARQLNVACGQFKYIATDAGAHVSPRYDVIEMPSCGDEVSYSFNGDTYPDGKIIKVSASLKLVVTDTGSKYYRRKLTGAWIKNGTWSLVRGHRNERNPSF